MKQEEIINEDGSKTIKIYTSYSDAQKKATKKYRENNKEKVNKQRKEYYLRRKEKDPNFLVYKRNKAKEYYNKKKELKEIKEEFKKAEPIVIEESKPINILPTIIEHPLIDESNNEKKKRKYTKKNKVVNIE